MIENIKYDGFSDAGDAMGLNDTEKAELLRESLQLLELVLEDFKTCKHLMPEILTSNTYARFGENDNEKYYYLVFIFKPNYSNLTYTFYLNDFEKISSKKEYEQRMITDKSKKPEFIDNGIFNFSQWENPKSPYTN